jgi:hypothetical protein
VDLLVRVVVGAVAFQLTGELVSRVPRVFLSRSIIPVASVAAVGAAGATFASGEPTAISFTNVVLRACFAVAVTVASARARRWAWLFASCATVAVSGGSSLDLLGFVAAGAALAMAMLRRRSWLIGAVVGACVSQVLLRLDISDTTGVTAVASGLIAGVLLASGLGHARRSTQKRIAFVTLAVGAVGAALSAGALIAALSAARDVRSGVDAAKQAISGARDGDTAAAATRFAAAGDSFDRANDVLGSWWATPALAVPIVSQQLDAVRTLSRAGSELSNSAAVAAVNVDVDGLRLRQGRVDLRAVERVADTLRPVVTTLAGVSHDVNGLSSPWLLGPLAEAVADLDGRVADAYDDARTASLALDVAQPMLGAIRERRWFLALMTSAELRASGGLIGTVGEIAAADGALSLKNTREVRHLNEAVDNDAAARAIPAIFNEEYAGWEVAESIQNASVAADFATTAQAIEAVQPLAGQGDFDGVIGVDPIALGALLGVVGPVTVPSWPEPIDANNAAEVLLHKQYVALPNDVRERFLSDVLNAFWSKVTEGDLPGPTVLARALSPMVEGRHIQLHSVDGKEQAVLTQLGADGSLPRGGVDRLSVITQNASESKADWFLRRSIDYDVTYDPESGATEGELTVTLTNNAPAAGLPPIVLGSRWAPPGHNRQIVEVHTPLDAATATVDEEPIVVSSTERSGARVHRVDVTVPPGGRTKIVFALRATLPARHRWVLEVGHQPLAHPDVLSVEVRAPRGWRATSVAGLEQTHSGAAARQAPTDGLHRLAVTFER